MANKETGNRLPPRLVTRFLAWYCHPDLLDEVEGDLYELFQRRVETEGLWKAKAFYCLNVLMFLHPDYVKRREQHYSITHTAMFKNYFKIAFRNLGKHKSFAVINIAGLTLGLSCALIIFLLVSFELSFDTFHSKADRIYRVLTASDLGDADSFGTGTPHGLAQILQEDFPEVEKVSTMYHLDTEKTQIEVAGNLIKAPHAYFATPSFFEIFDFQWLTGTPQKSLSQLGQVVISETLANKLFQGDAMGKSIRLNNEFDLVVSGIIADVPEYTDFPMQIVASQATFAASQEYNQEYAGSHGSAYQTYLLLEEGADPALLEAKFSAMVEKYLGKETAEKYLAHALQPLSDIHFDESFSGGNFSNRAISKASLWSIALIGALILLIASINFVNLATAQAVTRSKEVGVRKVMGSTRKQLVLQFIGETFTFTFLATIASVGLTFLLLPQLETFLDTPLHEHAIFQPKVLLWAAVLCIVVSLLAGIYPAIVLSGFQPVSVIKNTFSNKPSGGLLLRKGLVTFQFAITQILIIATIVVVSQNNFVRTQPLGFDQQAIITVDIPEGDLSKMENLRNTLSQYPDIKAISFSQNAPAATSNKSFNFFLHHSDQQKGKLTEVKPVDEYYLALYDITLLAGDPLKEGNSGILVNEALLKEIQIADPKDALGEVITIGGNEVSIKGVVQDFHTLSLHEKIYPLIMVKMESDFQLASFRIDVTKAQTVISLIEQAWKEAFPQYYFTYRFLDEDLASWYAQDRKTSRLLSLFAGIAIFIGCLGLYGLISFVTVQKSKEVGIRKVLGATVQHIVYLFTKDFVILLAVAFIIAAPLGYYFMQQWLADFTYKIELSWWMFALSASTGFVVAGITISFQSIKAALANPVDSLRSE